MGTQRLTERVRLFLHCPSGVPLICRSYENGFEWFAPSEELVGEFPFECVRRLAREQLGLNSLKSLEKVGELDIKYTGNSQAEHIFIAESKRDPNKQTPSGHVIHVIDNDLVYDLLEKSPEQFFAYREIKLGRKNFYIRMGQSSIVVPLG